MGLKSLFEKLASEHGEDVSDDLKALFSDDEVGELDFDTPLPGSAGQVLEVFSDEVFTGKADSEGLIWAPMIRAGQWALRPGNGGAKKRVPLRIVAGKSTDQRKEMGLQDLLEAFNDGAVENVTVPTSHNNTVLENTGYVEKMKIVDLTVAKGPMKGKKLPHLVGGYNFTEPDVKGKVERGTVAGRSCGILYDYSNTETGKTYPAVVEHVALTNKPWITGMQSFGRKLAMSEDVETVGMVFSDDDPTAEELSVTDADNFATETESGATVSWNHEDSPNWLRQQVNDTLDKARRAKLKSKRDSAGASYIYESVPYYRCVEAKSGTAPAALVSDGYGDGANHWVVPLNVSDGTVEVPEFSEWNAVKQVFVPDDRDPPAKKDEPLSEEAPTPSRPKTVAERRMAAAAARRARINHTSDDLSDPTNHSQGGDDSMSTTDGGSAVMELSDAAQAAIDEANRKAAEAEARAAKLSEQVERLTNKDKLATAADLATKAKALFGEGQAGALAYLHQVCLADDNEPAVSSEAFSEKGDTEVGLTATEMFERFFDALQKGEDGKVSLSAQATSTEEEPKNEELSEEEKLKAQGGKPAGKTGKADEQLSAEERAAKMKADLAEGGMKFSTNGNGDKGGES